MLGKRNRASKAQNQKSILYDKENNLLLEKDGTAQEDKREVM